MIPGFAPEALKLRTLTQGINKLCHRSLSTPNHFRCVIGEVTISWLASEEMEKSKHGRVSGIEMLVLFCVNHGKRLYRAKCVNSRDKQ